MKGSYVTSMFERPIRPLRLWWFGVFGLALADISYYSGNFIGWFITLGFFLIVPGYLLLSLLTKEIKSQWEIISYSLGLSILLLMLGGLALNTMHVIGLRLPLTTRNIFIMLDTLTLVLLLLNRSASFFVPRRLPHPSKELIAMSLVLTLLPFMAVGGAIRLNNGASDILTLILFGMIAIIFLLLAWRKKLVSLHIYAIIMMGISVLFTVSLRGWFITGHDIQREFYVFQLTSKSHYWNINTLRDPYNACLSITILPTIFAKITTISAPYIFKVVFQVIFAAGLAPVYLFIKRLSNERTALIVSFIFISFPAFLNDMPFLNRQEIAFVFFGLLMLTTFMKLARRQKTILTICCLLGLILSHYSSSYVTLAIFVLAAVFYKLLARKNTSYDKKAFSVPVLTSSIILVAMLLTFLWNFQITTSTQGLKNTLTQTVRGLLDHSSVQSGDVGYSLFAPKTKSPSELLANYAGSNSDEVQYVGQPNLPLTNFGKSAPSIINIENFNTVTRALSAKILQILLLFGVVVLMIRRRKKVAIQETYLLALALSCILLLALQTLLPQLSVDYGTLRFFQQALVVLGIPIVIGIETLLSFLRHRAKYIIAILFALLFLDLSGFVPQILGGYPPQLSLNNSGEYYELYYVHATEVKSATWLYENDHSITDGNVQSDLTAQFKILNYSSISLAQTQPLVSINNDKYIYESYSNILNGAYYVYLKGDLVRYEINNNLGKKNLIYNNSGSKVYR